MKGIHHEAEGLLFSEPDQVFGSLIAFQGQVFDATHGRVDVPQDKVDAHNAALDEALVEGMEKAKVGQWGNFYLIEREGQFKITLFTGRLICERPRVAGQVVTFKRGEQVWRGRRRKDQDLIAAKRIK